MIKVSILILHVFFSGSLLAGTYEVPPTSSTSTHVPVISDAAMEECVKLYNEAKWLSKKLNTIKIDSYSQSSVSNYNKQIGIHTKMTDKFNSNCAGKQSQSAYEAAKRLNAAK